MTLHSSAEITECVTLWRNSQGLLSTGSDVGEVSTYTLLNVQSGLHNPEGFPEEILRESVAYGRRQQLKTGHSNMVPRGHKGDCGTLKKCHINPWKGFRPKCIWISGVDMQFSLGDVRLWAHHKNVTRSHIKHKHHYYSLCHQWLMMAVYWHNWFRKLKETSMVKQTAVLSCNIKLCTMLYLK